MVNPDNIYRSEHSPMYTQWFWITLTDVPTYVVMHLRTHEKNGAVFFVKSNRDVPNIDRETPVNCDIMMNAKHLVDMARKRLCGKADAVTREVMEMIKESVRVVDHPLADYLVPNCRYRKSCPEPQPCRKETN